jgi:hypothetical protein
MRLGNVQDIFTENKTSSDPFDVLDLRNLLCGGAWIMRMQEELKD